MTAARDEYGDEDVVEGKSVNSLVDKKDNCNILVKFIADSGVTEHLSKSELIFEKIDENINHMVKCANKGNSLKTIGLGTVKFRTDRGGEFVLKDVLYSKELSENLLSLRQFVDQGLQIFLDNKKINIYNPLTKDKLVSGVYRTPFWIIKLKIIKNKDEIKDKYKSSALISTRSKSKMNSREVSQLSEVVTTEKDNENVKSSDLVSTGDNRKVHNVNFEPIDIEFEECKETGDESFEELESIKAIKWHRRLGHISRKYLLKFAKLNPNVLIEKDVKSDNKIEECEVCLIIKSTKLPFNSSRVRAEKPLQIIHTDTMGPVSSS